MGYSKNKLDRIKEKEKKDRRLREEQEAEMSRITKETNRKHEEEIKRKSREEKSKIKIKPVKKQRYFVKHKVESAREKGWKEVKQDKDKHDRVLGVKTNTSDLVLMEK